MIDAAGTTKFTYYAGGMLNTEDGPWSSDTVTYTYNNRLRASLSLQQPTGTWTNGFTYDAAHRLSTVSSPAGTFTYAYKVGQASRLPIKLSLPNSSYITNIYDNVARLTGTYLDNSLNTILDKNEYLYNAGNQHLHHQQQERADQHLQLLLFSSLHLLRQRKLEHPPVRLHRPEELQLYL